MDAVMGAIVSEGHKPCQLSCSRGRYPKIFLCMAIRPPHISWYSYLYHETVSCVPHTLTER